MLTRDNNTTFVFTFATSDLCKLEVASKYENRPVEILQRQMKTCCMYLKCFWCPQLNPTTNNTVEIYIVVIFICATYFYIR